MSNYQKEYKKQYNEKNKIVTFPLSNAFYSELKKRAYYLDVKTNSYAKNIVTEYLNDNVFRTLTSEKKEIIKEYIHISRGIANNINQIAHKTNIESTVDINILISSLKNYEDEFKKFITKI
ncbi:MAG: plasmid mobilization relaxosome protein MobC [Halarcobacter sp.]